MGKLIDIGSTLVEPLLDVLLQDKSTKKNIIWATDTYAGFGHGFTDREQINKGLLLQHADIIKPRIQKSEETQVARTRKKAEVFTPAWLCNRMNNVCDEEWFGRRDVFNAEKADHTWTVVEENIEFPAQKRRKIPLWQHYVDSRRLEITCGEAPYLVSRYDVSTGELIVPPKHRIGQLDRKLRIVNENTSDYEEWLKWTIRAFEATYGYEYQGDNLLLARINLLLTFVDYYTERWEREPEGKILHQVANKIAWNIWQMDGMKDTVPFGKPYEEYQQLSLFAMIPGMFDQGPAPAAIQCKIYDWRRDSSRRFKTLKNYLEGDMVMSGKKLFDYAIGNPPYQEQSATNGRQPPVYHIFMDEAEKVAKVVELITPARFLFNAGQTPKAWNNKKLNDTHFKVLKYSSNASNVFPNTEIKGGIAVSLFDSKKEFAPIKIFINPQEMKPIFNKVINKTKRFLSPEVVGAVPYQFADKLRIEHPELAELIPESFDLRTNVFEKLNNKIFFNNKGSKDYIKIYGLLNRKRTGLWISSKYVTTTANNYRFYKVLISKANGSGHFGEILAEPFIAGPYEGHTQSFLSIGKLNTMEESEKLVKYIKTKIFRAMLDVLKTTQDITGDKFKYVPLQDFTSSSDINWSKSIHEIDLQLYQKYGLDKKEIDFIETHVKEMA